MLELIAWLLIGLLLLSIVVLIPVFKVVSNIYPYSYTNARVRQMRSNLLSKEEFDDLLRRDYNDILYTLENTNLPSLTKYLEADLGYSRVDTALRTQLVKDLSKLKRISPTASMPLMSAILSKYDIQVIEAIVRSQKTKLKNKNDILNITEVFTEDFIRQKNHDLEDLRSELKNTKYETIFEKHYRKIQKGDYKDFEEELDKFYFNRLKKAAKDTNTKKYVKRVIDNHNIALVNQEEKACIPGGYLNIEELNSSKTLQDIKNVIEKKYDKTNANTKQELERELYSQLETLGKKLMGKNPLSESTITGYIALKTANVRNLNILLKMKSEGYSAAEIKKVMTK